MTGLRLTYHFDIATLLAGIILIIIAEIFTTGTAIENELKLTI